MWLRGRFTLIQRISSTANAIIINDLSCRNFLSLYISSITVTRSLYNSLKWMNCVIVWILVTWKLAFFASNRLSSETDCYVHRHSAVGISTLRRLCMLWVHSFQVNAVKILTRIVCVCVHCGVRRQWFYSQFVWPAFVHQRLVSSGIHVSSTKLKMNGYNFSIWSFLVIV